MEVVLLSDVYAEGYIRGAGAYRLATELRSAGFNTQVIDFASRLDEHEAKKIFDKFITSETLFVGVSNTFMSNNISKIFEQEWMIPLLQEYKNKFNLKFVIGGNRGGLAHYEKASQHLFDILVSGFADTAIVELAKALRDNSLGNLQGQQIDNQFFIDCKTNYEFINFNKSKIIWTDQDCIIHGEALPIETARGCKFRCAYCFYPGNGKGDTYKHLKEKTVLREELIRNYELFGTTVYDIMDDLLNDSPEKCEYLYDVFSSLPFKVNFGAYARSDLLIAHKETLPMLCESGAVGLQFGIETLHKKAGSAIGKGMAKERTIEGLHYIKENSNLSIGSGFIFGLPFEPIESIYDTIEWLDSKDCPLDNKEVYALSIPSLKSHFDHSKLMVNPLQYGYKDLEPNNESRMIWDNGYLTYNDAVELRNETIARIKHHNHFNAHQISRVYNTGYDIDTVINTPAYEFRQKYESIKPQSAKIKSIKERYLEKLYVI